MNKHTLPNIFKSCLKMFSNTMSVFFACRRYIFKKCCYVASMCTYTVLYTKFKFDYDDDIMIRK